MFLGTAPLNRNVLTGLERAAWVLRTMVLWRRRPGEKGRSTNVAVSQVCYHEVAGSEVGLAGRGRVVLLEEDSVEGP